MIERFEVTDSALNMLKRSATVDRASAPRVPALTTELLTRMYRREVAAVVVPGFYSPERCAAAVGGVDARKAIEWWLGHIRTDMNYIGIPYSVAMRKPAALKRYHRDAVANTRKVRSMFSPFESPVDRLRNELDELWPGGARVRMGKDGRYFVGLIRVMREAGRDDGLVHVDDVRETPTERLWSANVYLQVPPKGGELAMWNLKPGPKTNLFYRFMLKYAFEDGVQEIADRVLGKPAHVIKVKTGDLVLLDSARPHAVRGFTKGVRLSMQTFMTVNDPSAPIEMYS